MENRLLVALTTETSYITDSTIQCTYNPICMTQKEVREKMAVCQHATII